MRFHPLVFLITILLTGVTIYMGSRKPAKLVVSISPVEALGYRVQTGKKSIRKTGNGNLILRMAKEQLAKDKKKRLWWFLSLTVSLCVFFVSGYTS